MERGPAGSSPSYQVNLPTERPLTLRETPEFLAVAQRVREGLHAGHSYDD